MRIGQNNAGEQPKESIYMKRKSCLAVLPSPEMQ